MRPPSCMVFSKSLLRELSVPNCKMSVSSPWLTVTIYMLPRYRKWWFTKRKMRANRLMYPENVSLLFDPSTVSAQTSDSHSWGSWSCLRAWGHGTRLELSDASNGGKTIAPTSLLSCSYHLKCTMKKTNLRHPTAANVEDILQTETAVMIQNQPPFHRKTPQLHSP